MSDKRPARGAPTDIYGIGLTVLKKNWISVHMFPTPSGIKHSPIRAGVKL